MSYENTGVGGVYGRKIVSMNDLKRMFLLHRLQFEDLTRDVETGAADGYIRIHTESSFISFHVTSATTKTNGVHTICKS